MGRGERGSVGRAVFYHLSILIWIRNIGGLAPGSFPTRRRIYWRRMGLHRGDRGWEYLSRDDEKTGPHGSPVIEIEIENHIFLVYYRI